MPPKPAVARRNADARSGAPRLQGRSGSQPPPPPPLDKPRFGPGFLPGFLGLVRAEDS